MATTLLPANQKRFKIPAGTELQTSKAGGKGVNLDGKWIIIPKNLVDQFEDGAQHLIAEERESVETTSGFDAEGKPILVKRDKPVTLLFATAVFESTEDLMNYLDADQDLADQLEYKSQMRKAKFRKQLKQYELTDEDLSATV